MIIKKIGGNSMISLDRSIEDFIKSNPEANEESINDFINNLTITDEELKKSIPYSSISGIEDNSDVSWISQNENADLSMNKFKGKPTKNISISKRLAEIVKEDYEMKKLVARTMQVPSNLFITKDMIGLSFEDAQKRAIEIFNEKTVAN
jgi:hypothetical protein